MPKRKSASPPSALDAALEAPGPEVVAPAAPDAPAPHEVQPEVLKAAASSASRQMHAKAWGATALIAGAAALAAGVGTLVVRGMMRRAKAELPPPS